MNYNPKDKNLPGPDDKIIYIVFESDNYAKNHFVAGIFSTYERAYEFIKAEEIERKHDCYYIYKWVIDKNTHMNCYFKPIIKGDK